MYKDFINEVKFKGVDFKDISPLLADQETFRSAIVDMGGLIIDEDFDGVPDYWIGIDSRGFLFAAALSTYFGGGVVCARKEGKLPNADCSVEYSLEYGRATLEMQKGNGGKAVIVDDVLATGGTIRATNRLAELSGYDVIDNVVLIDLKSVPRVDDFDVNVKSVIEYE